VAHGQVFYEAHEERDVLSDDLDDEHVRAQPQPSIGCILRRACRILRRACRMLRGAS
jgi:hypothetical protein